MGKIMILAHTDGEGFNNYIHTSHKITTKAFLNIDIDIEFISHFPNRYYWRVFLSIEIGFAIETGASNLTGRCPHTFYPKLKYLGKTVFFY